MFLREAALSLQPELTEQLQLTGTQQKHRQILNPYENQING
jgi:hypothetical protein